MEIGVRIVGAVLLMLDWFLAPLVRWLAQRERPREPSLPPPDDPLLRLSATALAARIRNSELTSVEIVELYIKRAIATQPTLCAIVEEQFEAAREQARVADATVRAHKGQLADLAHNKPLLGVPFTVKESCSLAGLSDSVGVVSVQGRVAARDGLAVQRLRAAGAVPLLVSNTPEQCLGWETRNLLRPPTNNPYDTSRTPGGSSGGEAALIGAGASVFGVGSDIAGSIRIPAMFCGVFGHKPTPGIIPIEGHVPTLQDASFSKFLTVGPMCRYADDLLPLTTIMAGGDRPALRLSEPVQMDTVNVRYMCSAGQSGVMLPVDQEIQGKILAAVHYLKTNCGMQVYEDEFKEMENSVEISVSAFFGMEDIPKLLGDPKNPMKRINVFWELLKSVFGQSSRSMQALSFALLHATNLFIPRSKYQHYQHRLHALREQFQRVLGTSGVFLYPTFPSPAFYHNQMIVKSSGVLYTMIFNTLGLPATSVPMGLHQGMPIGIQVVAAPNQDRLCLAVAKQLEKGFGGWRPPLNSVKQKA